MTETDIPEAELPGEFEDMLQRLEHVPDEITGTHIPFYWQRGWRMGFERGSDGTFTPTEIIGDPMDVAKYGYEYGDHKTLHELGHGEISGPFLDGFTTEELNEEALYEAANWWEDDGDENYADELVDGGKARMVEGLTIDTAPGGRLDFALDKRGVAGMAGEMATVMSHVNYIPQGERLNCVARNYFIRKEMLKTIQTPADEEAFVEEVRAIDPMVADAFVKVREPTVRLYTTIPKRGDPKDVVDRIGKERKRIFKEEIWDPVVSDLARKSYDDQALVQFLLEMLKGNQFQSGDAQGPVIIIDISKLPKEARDEIMDMLGANQNPPGSQEGGMPMPGAGGASAGAGEQNAQPQPGGGSSSESSGDENKSDESQADAAGGSDGTGGDPSQADKDGGDKQQTGDANAAQDSGKDSATTQGEGQPQAAIGASKSGSPVDQLSDATKEKVKELWDQLSDADREALESDAARKMGEMEDDVTGQLQSHSDTGPGVGKTSVGQRMNARAEKKNRQGSDSGGSSVSGSDADSDGSGSQDSTGPADANSTATGSDASDMARISQAIRKMPSVQEAPKEYTAYDAVASEEDAAEKITYLDENCELNPNEDPEEELGKRGRLSMSHLIKSKARGGRDKNVQTKEVEPEKKVFRFFFVVDVSYSANRLRQDFFKFLVINSEYFAHQGVETGSSAFTDSSSGWGFETGVLHVLTELKDTEQGEAYAVDIADKNSMSAIADIGFGGGGTPMSTALMSSYDDVLLPRHEEKGSDPDVHTFLIVLTDGQPTDHMDATADTPALDEEQTLLYTMQVLQERAKEDRMKLNLVLLGVGAGTDFLKDAYPRLPEDLRDAIANELYESNNTDISPDDVATTFENMDDLIVAWKVMLEYIIDNPDDFARIFTGSDTDTTEE